MTSFFKKLVKSVYSPVMYQEIIKQPASKAVGYYFGMISLLALVITIVAALVLAPMIKAFISKAAEQIAPVYPADLRLTIQNGQLSINKPEPYKVRLPETLIKEQRDQGSVAPIENVAVVDTITPFSYERFASYNTIMWLTRDGVAMIDEDVRVRYIPFGTSTNQVIDKQLVDGLIVKIVPILERLAYLLAPFAFIFIFMLGTFNLAYCALLALLVWSIANKINHLNLTYSQAWSATLYLATLGTVWVVIDLCIPGFSIPFGFTIITLVLAYLNLGRTIAKTPETPPVTQSALPPSAPSV